MKSKEQAKIEVERLVQRFEDHKLDYKQSGYNETQTRRDFIDPFFKALGWDIDNAESASEAYRDVIHEDKVRIENKLKSPDYSFRLNGKRCFFVEAKKPSVNVKDDVDPAYQVKRYAWSAKLKLSIVTDFEEFAIYDCSSKPKPTDKASVARIDYIKHTEYINKFDFIWDTFSKEAVLTGGYDKFINKDKKKGTTSVDDDFLESLDLWRTALAKDIFKNNSKLSEDQLNQVVQHTIDRIIFLRIAEDRNIETYGSIQNCLKDKGSAYQALFKLFLKADEKYNSGLFDFKKYPISKDITVSDKCLSEIIENLYFPNSPYEFSVIPVEILGSAYEQFLGKTIQIKNNKINIDEKPEVRKARGVYYTPQYIVDYIVQNTVGKLIENKTPKEIEKIKVLDPASGSGSFLLGAYDYLLKYHLDWYTKNSFKSKGKKTDPLNPDGSLTTDVKKRILLNNIYGVDLDANAVEVTKLSLLLKCLEGETQASIQSQMTLFNERILPTLDSNIKCGNSLVDTDFYEIESDRAVLKKVKPFNWESNFPEVFKQGGFDAVIGNPPWVRQELFGDLKKYFKLKYEVFDGVSDLYTFFVEKGLELVNLSGRFSFIIPNKWIRTNYGVELRAFLSKQPIERIINFDDLQVFKDATTYPCILIVNKSNKTPINFKSTNLKSLDFVSLDNVVKKEYSEISTSLLDVESWCITSDDDIKLLNKLKTIGVSLKQYNNQTYRGILTGLNDAFVISEATKDELIKKDKKSKEIIKPFLAGRDVKRYQFLENKNFLIFTRHGIDLNKYSAIKTHLNKYKMQLEPKPKGWKPKNKDEKWPGRKSGSYKWYEIQDTIDYYLEFEKNKIIYPNICSRPEFTFDMNCLYTNQKCFIIPTDDYYLLGILNSKVVHYLFTHKLPKLRGGFFEPSYIMFSKFPIKKIDLNAKSEKIAHDKIVKYVNKLLQLNKEANPDLNQIQYYENQIDKLVYELYGLTEDEIRIVEEATHGNS